MPAGAAEPLDSWSGHEYETGFPTRPDSAESVCTVSAPTSAIAVRLVRPQRQVPEPARPGEIRGVRPEELHLEVRLEAEHQLRQVRADRLRKNVQHDVAERPAAERRCRVWRIIMSDRLQTDAAAWLQPLEAAREESPVGVDPFARASCRRVRSVRTRRYDRMAS